MEPSAGSTLVIIVGASEFPKWPSLSNETFRRSAHGFKDYLLHKNGFGLPEKNLFDLFDRGDAAMVQYEEVETFLQTRIRELAKTKCAARDLILYYVGHGGFIQPGD